VARRSQEELCPVHRVYCDERAVRNYDGIMPSGLKRFQKAEALHFITFSCFHRMPLLQTPAAREVAEAVLEKIRARHTRGEFTPTC
jgi:hypothetical protein